MMRDLQAVAAAVMLALSGPGALAQQAAPTPPAAAPAAPPAATTPAPAAPAPPAAVAPAPAPAAPAVPPPATATPVPASPAPPPAAPAPGTPPAAATPAPVAPNAAPAETAKPGEVSPLGTPAEVAARPVLRLKGKSTWDDGFDNLRKALDRLEEEAKKANLVRDGYAMTYFVDSDDNGFTYEAMVPLKEAPAAGASLGKDIDATTSPAGKAIIFRHEGAYDDIDTAYEAFTAWLDDKNLVSTGKFLEEYEFWPGKSDDGVMKIRIIVFLK